MTDTQTVVWATVIILSLAFVSFTIVGGIAFFRAGQGQAKSFGLMFERGNFLRLATAVLIILATILLAALGKLTAEGVASILSGVAGYVLGGLDKQQQKPVTESTGPKGGE